MGLQLKTLDADAGTANGADGSDVELADGDVCIVKVTDVDPQFETKDKRIVLRVVANVTRVSDGDHETGRWFFGKAASDLVDLGLTPGDASVLVFKTGPSKRNTAVWWKGWNVCKDSSDLAAAAKVAETLDDDGIPTGTNTPPAKAAKPKAAAAPAAADSDDPPPF